jgi:hypothetical protein
MTDHPFDEIAVEQLARHMAEAAGFKSHDWAPFITRANRALTAACKSMKERGKARDGKGYDLPRETPPSDWAIWTDKKPGFENECFYVTIFRHGE